MNEKKLFEHAFSDAMYEKAMTKYRKMLETESGKKFFEHIAKAFYLNNFDKKDRTPTTVKTIEGSQTGLFRCDITGQKLISEYAMLDYQAIYETKLLSIVKTEDESEEQYNARLEMYKNALYSSNPYAINCNLGYTAPKTDKHLSIEAFKALKDICDEIIKNPAEYGLLGEILNPKVIEARREAAYKEWMEKRRSNTKKYQYKVKEKESAKSKGFYSTGSEVKNNLEGNEALMKLKAKFK